MPHKDASAGLLALADITIDPPTLSHLEPYSPLNFTDQTPIWSINNHGVKVNQLIDLSVVSAAYER